MLSTATAKMICRLARQHFKMRQRRAIINWRRAVAMMRDIGYMLAAHERGDAGFADFSMTSVGLMHD